MGKLNSYKILVFGLPGSGKTTFAKKLAVNMAYFNADEIRKMFGAMQKIESWSSANVCKASGFCKMSVY